MDARSTRPYAAGDTVPNLTVDTAVPYLVARDLVSVASIVDGDLEVVDVGRRNQNLKVVCKAGPSYLVKQPGEGEHATEETVRCEATFYRHCQAEHDAADLRGIVPELRRWDEDRCLLVLDLIDGRPLWSHYAATSAPGFSADSSAPLGHALGTLHRVFRLRSAQPRGWLAGLHRAPPWILFAHRPTPEILARLSPANRRVLTLVQRDRPLSTGLDGLRDEWTPDTLIHTDIKGDNVLVATRADGEVLVHLVDWELVQIGDAAWDVGTVLRDFLDYWLLSVPLSGDLTPEQMLEGAQVPLAKLHPATRAFWTAYRGAARLDADDHGSFLLRSVRFAGARLAQGAYDLSASAHQPSNRAVAMLQLAANILADPREAALHLFGIPVPWRRPGHGSAHG